MLWKCRINKRKKRRKIGKDPTNVQTRYRTPLNVSQMSNLKKKKNSQRPHICICPDQVHDAIKCY